MKSAGKWLQKSPGWKESLNKSLPLDITLFTLPDDKLFYSIRCISLFLSISLAHQEESKGRKGRLLFATISKIDFALLYKIYLGNISLIYVLYSKEESRQIHVLVLNC